MLLRPALDAIWPSVGKHDVDVRLIDFPQQLNPFAVPLPDLSPNPLTIGTNVNITRIVELANGNMLIEFPSALGRAYTVVYSDNVLFSNAMIAPPVIVAPANRTQWIDYGPPATANAPLNTGARFYRVFQNP